MLLATQYLGRVGEYRGELLKTAKSEGSEALMRKLRSPSDVDRDYRDFYRIFDETFLGIFPDFVEQVNALLEEPARFPVRADRTLPTELRILAVMRLGITDSGRIAVRGRNLLDGACPLRSGGGTGCTSGWCFRI